MSRTITVLLISLFFCNYKALPQLAGYEMFAHYSNENGLPQNSVNAIMQDKKGFVWMATNSGLVRFDGHSFRTFNMVSYSSKSSNRIHHLFTFRGKLFAEESWVEDLFEIVDENTIHTIKRDSIVVLWKMAIAYKISRELSLYKRKYTISSLNDFITDSNGRKGYYQDSITGEILQYNFPDKPVNLKVQSWQSMEHSFTMGGRLYSIDQFRQLKCFDGNKPLATGGSLARLIESSAPAFIKSSRFIQTDSVVYFATNTSVYKIFEKTPGVAEAELLTGFANQPNKVSFLFLPSQQVILMGTGNDGLYLYRQRQFTALQVPEILPPIYDQSPNLFRPVNIFYPVAQLNDSTILTNWGGLTLGRKIIPAEKIVFQLRNIVIPAPGFFIGFRPGFSEVPHITDSRLNDMGLFDPVNNPEGYFQAAREDDTLYFRLLIKGRIVIKRYLYQPPHTFIPAGEYPDPGLDAYCMLKTNGDTLWLGTTMGVYIINLTQKKIQQLAGLEQTVVRALYADVSGKIWIGTYGKGWYLYDKGKLVKLYMDRNRNLENVHAFLEDDHGYLWISTNNGLFRFLKSDLEKVKGPDEPVYYNYFSREYGFYTNEFNGGSSPAALRMRNGKFVLPGMNGLVVFDPLKVPLEMPSPRILTGEYLLNGKPIDKPDGLTLPPNFNNISLRVFVPYFGQHYNLQLEYRLSSGTGTWTRLQENGVISFNQLAQGNYILSLRMLKGFGSGEYITEEIKFSVAPRWYQTSLFYISSFLLLILLSALYVRWRTGNIKKQKLYLENEVALRTEALKTSEEKVRQNAQFKSQVTSLVLHDVRSPLYYLNKITGSIYQSTAGQVPDNIREELKDLHLSVKDISAYAQTLFAWISAQQDNFILRPVKIKLAALLEEICTNYHLLAAQNNNSISFKEDQQLSVVTQTDLLQIVIRNLVDNAIKFTNNGQIELSAAQVDGAVHITVKDTGKGMTADRVKRILGNDENDVVDTRSGMGYRLIRDLLKKMDGKLAVVSEPGKGSAVTVILPAATADK